MGRDNLTIKIHAANEKKKKLEANVEGSRTEHDKRHVDNVLIKEPFGGARPSEQSRINKIKRFKCANIRL